MNLYNKVRYYIDYNNHYTIQKTLRTLDLEFNKALKTNNMPYAKEILNVVHKIYEDFSEDFVVSESFSETASYAQKSLLRKMRSYIAYLSQKLKTNPLKEIKQAIEPVSKSV